MKKAELQLNTVDDILISIIVPVYNVEAYLPQCIDSLLAQTHPNLEIILVDDGSTDNSGAICEEYAAHHNNIIVVRKENGGASSARNAGIALANGEYLGFADGDDFVDKTMFRTLLEAAVNQNVSISACGRYITSEDGNITDTQFALPYEKVYTARDASKELLISGSLDVAVWDKLFKKELFSDIEFPVGEINEEAVIIFHLFSRSSSIVHIGKPMYYYRGRSGSVTKSSYKPNKIQALEHAEAIELFLAHTYPELIPFCKEYLAFLCCQLLSLMLKNPLTPKEYPDHYKKYLSILRKNIGSLLSNKNIELAWKIRGLMIYLNLYGILYRLFKK